MRCEREAFLESRLFRERRADGLSRCDDEREQSRGTDKTEGARQARVQVACEKTRRSAGIFIRPECSSLTGRVRTSCGCSKRRRTSAGDSWRQKRGAREACELASTAESQQERDGWALHPAEGKEDQRGSWDWAGRGSTVLVGERAPDCASSRDCRTLLVRERMTSGLTAKLEKRILWFGGTSRASVAERELARLGGGRGAAECGGRTLLRQRMLAFPIDFYWVDLSTNGRRARGWGAEVEGARRRNESRELLFSHQRPSPPCSCFNSARRSAQSA